MYVGIEKIKLKINANGNTSSKLTILFGCKTVT